MRKIIIDPMTRVSGVLKIEVEVENNKIIDARSSGGQFRGFERMFNGRPPLDIIRLAPRVCGICSTHHALAATLAIENALGVTPDFNGKVARDITNGFEFLQNHLRHLYFFAFPDFVEIADIDPLHKNLTAKEADYRLPPDITRRINEDYAEAVEYSRLAHRAIAVMAGKAPHCHGIFVGGITTTIGVQQVEAISYTVKVIKEFIENKLMEDIYAIAEYYNDYYAMGKGDGNFMDYGLFSDYLSPEIKYSSPGVIINGIKEGLDINHITENVAHSWFENAEENIIPGASEPSIPNAYKKDGYTWVNAARYKGYAMEGGPLARMILNGYYNHGISAMDRLVARVLEGKKICESIEGLIGLLKVGKPYQEQWVIPDEASGVGITAAARGCLGHWITIKDKKVLNYALIPPSTWNLSPTDSKGVKGPVEQALIGTEIASLENPVEIGRIVRSFDPCLNCAAHVVSDSYEPFTINLV